MKKLFLDDCRPCPVGWDYVENYSEFVDYIERLGVPDVISFDHDLADQHYPNGLLEAGPIDYKNYTEKTGYDCAMYLVSHVGVDDLPFVIVHSFNPAGARNIANLLKPFTAVMIRPYDRRNYE